MTAEMKSKNQKKQSFYPAVDASPDFPAIERGILEYWKEAGAFAASVENRPATKSGDNNEYIFYDGPPFANGLPHYGHLLTGFVKDLYARYHTTLGERVERRFGWDCHGLPAEMGAEKELGVSGRANIEKFGIQKFNDYCRTSVMKYTSEWEDYVTRQARWVDFENDYKTMDKNYMESVMWAFSELHKKGLVYESHRVMPYSWAMETPVSNFETRMDNSYREREDKAVTVAFRLKDKPKGAPEAEEYYVLAWTTTPWTLPSNLALAVKGGMDYRTFLLEDGTCQIFAKFAEASLTAKDEVMVSDGDSYLKGSDLLGLEYEPLFPYFKDHPNSFKIIAGDFIEEGSGTGIVHIAPGFGEDDQRVAAENGIGIVCPVDASGRFTDEIFEHDGLALHGLNVVAENSKSEDEPYTEKQLAQYGLANLRIITYLKGTGQLIKQEDYRHNYPHCWRTDTPLIYRALPSWYVEVSKFAPRMVELNEQINWIPDHIKHGRFGKWLEGARDWSISRNRYWGSPIPVWKNDKDDEIKVFGSIAELEAFFGQKVEDLHRPFIDELVKEENGRTWRRVNDVFDCWFESGSMPYAQVHYPFENKDWFESHFPADFIVEYEAQTRGWFYTLMVLSTALFDKPPFKNCICHGVVLDDKGEKLSKRLNNYADPNELFAKYGADALRWFMMSSPVMRGAEMHLDKEGAFIRDAVRLYIRPMWNAYNFFTLYANADGVRGEVDFTSANVMDRYILSKLAHAVRGIEQALDGYDTPAACGAVTEFFEVLNNWYIRRNRARFWKEEADADKQAAYNTLYTVLHVMARATSPLLPLISEEIYLGLTQGGARGKAEFSVHLADFPKAEAEAYQVDAALMQEMDRVRDACNAAHAIRNAAGIRTRQPLAEIKLIGLSGDALGEEFSKLVLEEVNVKSYVTADASQVADYATHKAQVNLPVVGKKLGIKVKAVMGAIRNGEWEQKPDGTLHIAGEVLHEGEYSVLLEPKPEYKGSAQALSTNDALVVLDLTVTPELEREGIARDVVRLIQQARKDADLDISDRISLTLHASAEVQEAVREHAAYICDQTLASAIAYGEPQNTAFRFDHQLDDQPISIGLSTVKAAA